MSFIRPASRPLECKVLFSTERPATDPVIVQGVVRSQEQPVLADGDHLLARPVEPDVIGRLQGRLPEQPAGGGQPNQLEGCRTGVDPGLSHELQLVLDAVDQT